MEILNELDIIYYEFMIDSCKEIKKIKKLMK